MSKFVIIYAFLSVISVFSFPNQAFRSTPPPCLSLLPLRAPPRWRPPTTNPTDSTTLTCSSTRLVSTVSILQPCSKCCCFCPYFPGIIFNSIVINSCASFFPCNRQPDGSVWQHSSVVGARQDRPAEEHDRGTWRTFVLFLLFFIMICFFDVLHMTLEKNNVFRGSIATFPFHTNWFLFLFSPPFVGCVLV